MTRQKNLSLWSKKPQCVCGDALFSVQFSDKGAHSVKRSCVLQHGQVSASTLACFHMESI